MKHFHVYPKIEYSDNMAVNIMIRGKIREQVLNNHCLYYKYTITDDMKAETLSYKYYGTPSHVWAIYYANNIFDPVMDWPLSSKEFNKYIISKYGSIQKAAAQKTQDGKINYGSIHHFVLIDKTTNLEYVIDRDTFVKEGLTNPNSVKAITFYDYEYDLNEKKRQIKILDQVYLSNVLNEFYNLFK